MKSIFKILVLGAVPVLAVTMVANPALAADKGSQLIFQANMAHKSFISVANAHDKQAVTVLTQYYNDEMKLVLWYLRVLTAVPESPHSRLEPSGRPLRPYDSGHGH